MRRLLLYNAVVLAVFCAVWVWGYYMSDFWMRIIDVGVPYSWFVALFAASYLASFFRLRKGSWAALKAAVPPSVAALWFCLFIHFCDIAYDPFY